MKISKKSQFEVLGWSFLAVLLFLSLYNLTYGDMQTDYEDTLYFEPVPGVKMSSDGDTFYVNPGDDLKITYNLKNNKWIASFSFLLEDKCYNGNVFLDTAKNNDSTCFEGSRVPQDWEIKALGLDYYPRILLHAHTMMAEQMPPGDGPVATLTFTAIDSGSVYLDTFFYTAGYTPPHVIDSLGIGHTVELMHKKFYVELCPYNPGDLNWDGIVDILDVPRLVYYLFKDWEAPCPIKAADANCDEQVTIADAVFLVNYVLRSGPAPEVCDY